ncbi:MAG: ROK family protein, partial [Treponema sp.]|nr:ROK family protein [Treponema sp.]
MTRQKYSKEFIVGIDVGGTNIKILIMTSSFSVVHFSSIATEAKRGYDVISDNIISEIEAVFTHNSMCDSKIAAIAMGLPGTVFIEEQLTGDYLSVLGWSHCNPCKKIGEHFNAPCRIDNDANLNALGEYSFGINKRVP